MQWPCNFFGGCEAVWHSISSSGKAYQDMQNQLESLMVSAERLKADIAQDRSDGAENERSEHQVQVSSPDFDRRFEQLLRKFLVPYWSIYTLDFCLGRSQIDSWPLSA